MTTEGKNETRTLQNGEIVSLVRRPGEKWRISNYETQLYKGGVLEWKPEVPEHWRSRVFESSDDAFSYVEQEIATGKVRSNRRKT